MKHAVLASTLAIALTGCAGAGREPVRVAPLPYADLIDAVWGVVVKHEAVWLDDIRMIDSGEDLGVIMKCHLRDSNVRALTAFRRDLKKDPILSHHFPSILLDVSYRKSEIKVSGEDYALDFDVILVSKR